MHFDNPAKCHKGSSYGGLGALYLATEGYLAKVNDHLFYHAISNKIWVMDLLFWWQG